MDFYHDTLFISEILAIVLEARRKRQYLTRIDQEDDDQEDTEIYKYTKVENDLLNLAQFLHEDLKNDN